MRSVKMLLQTRFINRFLLPKMLDLGLLVQNIKTQMNFYTKPNFSKSVLLFPKPMCKIPSILNYGSIIIGKN